MKQCLLDKKEQPRTLGEFQKFNREYEDRIDKIRQSIFPADNTLREGKLDFETNKEGQIRAVRRDQFEKTNCLQYLKAIEVLSRTIPRKMVTLEREFDRTICADID